MCLCVRIYVCVYVVGMYLNVWGAVCVSGACILLLACAQLECLICSKWREREGVTRTTRGGVGRTQTSPQRQCRQSRY
jgi:hypothetical protein